uniref:BTB domain-containing protein n=1 Tax=Rhabditophanes sp. KR3021 TaxID=114890 RepID=A0AC35U2A5_9BILA
MTYERYKDLKVILKDGSVMVSRVIMHAHNNFFSQILEATPEITEVECRELTVREMKMYLQYVYKVREFVFDEENIFDMINVDQAIQSDDLTVS